MENCRKMWQKVQKEKECEENANDLVCEDQHRANLLKVTAYIFKNYDILETVIRKSRMVMLSIISNLLKTLKIRDV